MLLRICKMIDTSGFLAALECIKFVFGRGSAPYPTGGAYSGPPDPLAGLRGPTSKKGRGGRVKGREKREEGNGRDRPPPLQIPGSAPGFFRVTRREGPRPEVGELTML